MLSEYYLKAESDLTAQRDRINRWTKRGLEGEDETLKRRYYEEIQGLESKCGAAEIALNTCKFSEPEDESARERLEEALTDLRESMERFARRFGLERD
ncbi:MAG: hypothetical protein HPY83_08715 [Anaerolineae bacterium]|nr:hypothetical protein [Anaerolineae bacterium]